VFAQVLVFSTLAETVVCTFFDDEAIVDKHDARKTGQNRWPLCFSLFFSLRRLCRSESVFTHPSPGV